MADTITCRRSLLVFITLFAKYWYVYNPKPRVCLGMIYFEFGIEHSIFYKNQNWFKTRLYVCLNSTYLGKETLVFVALPWLRHDEWYFYSRYTKA